MVQKIVQQLKNIEEQRNVKIIFACESGSRAWGFPSQDSDYDVRFIYVRTIDSYLSISEQRDVIELPISDLLDINGWDLRKALNLLRKSNPPFLEWLQSPIIYYEDPSVMDQIRNLAVNVFSVKATLHHYLSMAKGNFREYLQGDLVRAKKYFYVLRPILACLWIENYHRMPPTEFEKLLTIVENKVVLKEVLGLLERKKSGEELDCEPKIQVINDFLEEGIQWIGVLASKVEQPQLPDETMFNDVFRTVLKQIWHEF